MSFAIPRTGKILRYNVSWQELEEILAEREDSSDIDYESFGSTTWKR